MSHVTSSSDGLDKIYVCTQHPTRGELLQQPRTHTYVSRQAPVPCIHHVYTTESERGLRGYNHIISPCISTLSFLSPAPPGCACPRHKPPRAEEWVPRSRHSHMCLPQIFATQHFFYSVPCCSSIALTPFFLAVKREPLEVVRPTNIRVLQASGAVCIPYQPVPHRAAC